MLGYIGSGVETCGSSLCKSEGREVDADEERMGQVKMVDETADDEED